MIKKRPSLLKHKENLWGYLFTLPWIIGFGLFFAYPIIYSVALSLSKVIDITTWQLEYRGFDNFRHVFLTDVDFIPLVIESVTNMIINTPVVVVFSLFIAILLNREIKLKGIYRAAFFLPVLIGTGAVMGVLQSSSSVLSFGSDAQTMQTGLTTTQTSLQEITVSARLTMLLGPVAGEYMQAVLDKVSEILWMSGIQIIIFLGALQTIPDSYYEAAFCDGATEWEKFWKVTLPLIMPTVLLNTIYTMIDYFTNMNNPVIMFTIQKILVNTQFDIGSAMGWIYFIVIGVVVSMVFFIMKRYTFYMGDK